MLNRKKIIPLVFFLGITVLIVTNFLQTTYSTPDQGDSHFSCHNPGLRTISTSNATTFTVSPSATFKLDISATGTNANVEVYATAKDNSKFVVAQSMITDNSANDTNPAADNIQVTLTFTAPAESGNYKLFILSRDPAQAPPPEFAKVEIAVVVGAGGGIVINLFSHFSFYLGLAAVLCLLVGTLLYEKNNQLTRAHGILAAAALILTTINIIFIIPATSSVVGAWVGGANIDWLHFIHIAFGIIGYGAGIIAVFTGISGIRTKKPGYVALIFWSFNLIFGLSYWGIVF